MKLTPYEQQVLDVLHRDCGTTVKEIRLQIIVSARHGMAQSAASRLTHLLTDLERRGLVVRLDRESPIAWVRV